MLFGPHQKHDILGLKEGADYVRECIHNELKKGKLKKDFTENQLLEIREYSLRMEKFKNETVKKIENTFREIINVLKSRRNALIDEILEKFSSEKEKIAIEEQNWNNKQDVSEKLLQIMNDRDDRAILTNSRFVMDGIRLLNEKLDFKEIRVFNDLDTNLTIPDSEDEDKQITLNLEQIIALLSNYLTICDPNILEFKA